MLDHHDDEDFDDFDDYVDPWDEEPAPRQRVVELAVIALGVSAFFLAFMIVVALVRGGFSLIERLWS